ncbi:hypothetical protein [Burkholderia diffusa]|uniref:hypothetical protein n=1 Tax=Burkholderia diffusa TaxID=488732 RepID=UPI00157AEE86|nr:hypothetical protein [Burkholderia diffusa]NTY36595.1 hypothetical protein [Burkholderia diffusa]
MTEWTGFFYGFYANKKIHDVLGIFERKIQEIGYQYKIDDVRGEISFFSYKDKEMLKRHREVGYNLNSNGEGAFSIEAKIVNLNGIALLKELNGLSDFDPCDINLMFDDVSYFFLILPDLIENSNFCLKIRNLLVDSIKQVRSE